MVAAQKATAAAQRRALAGEVHGKMPAAASPLLTPSEVAAVAVAATAAAVPAEEANPTSFCHTALWEVHGSGSFSLGHTLLSVVLSLCGCLAEQWVAPVLHAVYQRNWICAVDPAAKRLPQASLLCGHQLALRFSKKIEVMVGMQLRDADWVTWNWLAKRQLHLTLNDPRKLLEEAGPAGRA